MKIGIDEIDNQLGFWIHPFYLSEHNVVADSPSKYKTR